MLTRYTKSVLTILHVNSLYQECINNPIYMLTRYTKSVLIHSYTQVKVQAANCTQ